MDSNQTQQVIGSAIITAAFIVGACILFAGAVAAGRGSLSLQQLIAYILSGIFLAIGVVRMLFQGAQRVVGQLKQELDKD